MTSPNSWPVPSLVEGESFRGILERCQGSTTTTASHLLFHNTLTGR